MKIGDLRKSQQDIIPKIDDLCSSPIASSKDEVELWENNHAIYLMEKARKVSALPEYLQEEVDQVYAESMQFYSRMIDAWYNSNWESLKFDILLNQQESGLISEDQMRSTVDEIENTDVQTINKNEKIVFYFDFFESMLENIRNKGNWRSPYHSSRLGSLSDRLVWNVGMLDLFAWQLPSADNRNINDYHKLSRIMAIFFFFEMLYKNWSQLESRETDPFTALFNLERIVSYYVFSKKQEDA